MYYHHLQHPLQVQVVDSMCSVEGKEGDLSPLQPAPILAGTHIDLLHPDIKFCSEDCKEMILPQLVEELADKRYAKHLVEGINTTLEQFISNKCRDEGSRTAKEYCQKSCSITK